MRKVIVFGILCFFLFSGAAPALASGLLDEVLFTSEWWAKEDQQGEIEFFTLGVPGGSAPGNIYFLALRQETRPGNVFALNGSLGYEQMVLLNATAKFGTPDFYYGFGGMIFTIEQRLLFFPRLNLGGKFGPDLFKLVLDTDFYSFLLVNTGKLEVGLEILPLEQLRLYGGLIKLFSGTWVTSELASGNIYQLAAQFGAKPFFVGGELYFVDEAGPVMIGEAGVDFSLLSLCGRVCLSPQDGGKLGAYTIGLRVSY